MVSRYLAVFYTSQESNCAQTVGPLELFSVPEICHGKAKGTRVETETRCLTLFLETSIRHERTEPLVESLVL